MASDWQKSVGSVLLWYGTNIGIICINKSLLSHHDFKFPIFLTFLHMCSAMFWSEVMAKAGFLVKQNIVPSQKKAILLLGTLFTVSVVSGNISFKYIEISFAQAIGATTPVFTAVQTALFLKRYEVSSTYLTLIPVVIGAAIATLHEPRFNFIGFMCGLNAAWTRASRSVLQEKLMSNPQENEVKLTSLNLLRYMAPVAAAYLFVATIIMEPSGPGRLLELMQHWDFCILLSINLVLAYFVNLGGMMVNKFNGALTLQVLGNMKGAVATTVSVMIFQNPISNIAIAGYAMCIFGVWLYSETSKRNKMKPIAVLDREVDNSAKV